MLTLEQKVMRKLSAETLPRNAALPPVKAQMLYGNPETFGSLCHQELNASLQRYCLSLTRSVPDAEDLAQETWTKALGYSKFTHSPNPEALLLRMAKNTWIDTVRRRSSFIRALERSSAAVQQTGTQTGLSGISDIELAFQALCRYLTPLQRAAFVLRDVLGYSAAESAGSLGTTEGAVKAALHRARLALAKVKEELGAGDGPAFPLDADYRAYLRALALAYEQGQIPVMLELLRQEHAAEVTVAVSSSTVQAYYSSTGRSSSAAGGSTQLVLQMAA
ncbi:RNA polymerase sigma factor [Paenibacillus sp. MMS20-IR301]|uniref:RNA polymerase sigma factor n=1 Tax=Paenibacillus sp. MMS20-IR301 TaxID=2895946 RepID=UPI0028F14ADE|nr:RNA polymerase sigma factor [Paenibacillus sp. MMS20-IR301]WNS46270.1 RNA polymerase sigma factor [Paenibacillus sp. MMS20-IR301]